MEDISIHERAALAKKYPHFVFLDVEDIGHPLFGVDKFETCEYCKLHRYEQGLDPYPWKGSVLNNDYRTYCDSKCAEADGKYFYTCKKHTVTFWSDDPGFNPEDCPLCYPCSTPGWNTKSASKSKEY